MADNMNIDPLEALISQHKAAAGIEQSPPKITTPTKETPDELGDGLMINPSDSEGKEVADPALEPTFDYGDNDIDEEIANEDTARQEAREVAAKEIAEKKDDKPNVFMPPDEHDMKYHDDAISYQGEKLNIVSGMVNRVVAKYRIISGGIPNEPIPNLGVIGKMAVMGELVDMYHRDGDKISHEFEDMILRNWVMPDGSLAINNINTQGIVIDKTMMAPATTAPKNDKDVDDGKTEKAEAPTINITVEKNTPVTVNVDESIVAQTATTNEVNIIVKEVSEDELLKSLIVENSEQPGIIKPYDPGINDVPITLPLSGYRCVMRGINWADFIKLTAPSSNNSSDAEIKKWSVIYEHIKNPSIGEFKDFDDFLKKTKYQDRELLMWAILVATADDEETLSIKCGNKNCGKQIKITYSPRTITHIDPERNPSWYFAAHNAAVGEDAIKVWKTASCKRKRYKLPHTGIIVEINEPSAYEFITQKLPLINEIHDRFYPDRDITESNLSDAEMAEFDYLTANALFISAMSIVVNENGGKPKEYRFTNWNQIEEIITKSLDAYDSGLLIKLIEKVRTNVSPISFRVENINCPSCGRHEDYIPITDIGSTLLFQVSRRLSNTQINLIEMD